MPVLLGARVYTSNTGCSHGKRSIFGFIEVRWRLCAVTMSCSSRPPCHVDEATRAATQPQHRRDPAVTIDTLRADRVGRSGRRSQGDTRPRPAGPLAVTAFLDATAHAPLTLPSHTSILTGRYPPTHGVHDNGGFVLASTRCRRCASLLQGAGYHTAAFVVVVRAARRHGPGARLRCLRRSTSRGRARCSMTCSSLERRGPEKSRVSPPRGSHGAPAVLSLGALLRSARPLRSAAGVCREISGAACTTAKWRPATSASRRCSTPSRPSDAPARSSWRLPITARASASTASREHGILLYDSTLHVPLVMAGPGVPAGASRCAAGAARRLLPTISRWSARPVAARTGRHQSGAARRPANGPHGRMTHRSRMPRTSSARCISAGVRSQRA